MTDDTNDEGVTAFKLEVDVFPDTYDTFERLQAEVRDTAYEFVLKMEQLIDADQLGDVVYDEEHLRLVFEDESVDYAQMEVIVEIHSQQYKDEVDAMGAAVSYDA